MSAADLLATYAPAAGLSSAIDAFPKTGALRDRLHGNPFLQAPMAGVSDAAYRLMSRAGGAALAYTEMVSVNGLHYGSDKTWGLVLPDAAEPDIAVQLFGSDPTLFEEAARAVLSRLGSRLVLLDVNMACPVPKVVRNGAGSALLDDEERAASIVGACLRGVSGRVPVTAKIRLGRRRGEDVSCSFAHALADAGASAIAVHGRTAAQMYAGEANWEALAHVARDVEMPVIGSGDVRDGATAARMRETTGVCGVMLARGSYGNPWAFGAASRLRTACDTHAPSLESRLCALECHLRLLVATGAHLARGRSLCGWYLRGLPHAAAWRDEAMSCVGLDDYLRLLASLRARVGEDRG